MDSFHMDQFHKSFIGSGAYSLSVNIVILGWGLLFCQSKYKKAVRRQTITAFFPSAGNIQKIY
jgi:hypothetical protein